MLKFARHHGRIDRDNVGIRALLFCKFLDGIGMCVLDKLFGDEVKKAGVGTIELGGRTDRDDPADLEKCYLLPISEFVILGQHGSKATK